MSEKDRGAGGKFLPGNTAAKKNTNIARAARFRNILFRSVNESEFQQICRRMIEDALAGTARDREQFFNRLLGTPGEGLDLVSELEELKTQVKILLEAQKNSDKQQ